MRYEICTRLTAKIRRLGHPRRYAERLARFLVVQVILIDVFLDVFAVAGVLSMLDVSGVPARTLWERITGLDTPAAEPFDVLRLPAACGIHR